MSAATFTITETTPLYQILDWTLEHCFGGILEAGPDSSSDGLRDDCNFCLDDIDTETCEGCRDVLTSEAMEHDVEGVPLCPTCWAELCRERDA